MLESLYLTKSKVRGKILGLLFSNTTREFYLSELARQAKTSPGNVQRELSRLIKDGLIRRQKKANAVFYSVNPAHALYPEIQSLILKTTGVEGALKTAVNKIKEIKLALIYGSFAKESENGESDIDLLVVATGESDRFYAALQDLEKKFKREVNPTVYNPEEFSKKSKDPGQFLFAVLKEPYRLLKGNLIEFQEIPARRPRKKN